MRTEHFISLDVHCKFSEMAVVTRSGRLTKRHRCETAVPPLVEAIVGVPRPRYATFEEGPLADWLCRHLSPHADQVLVCEPRRNHLIAKDSDKDDPIDAEKLAHLFRGGFLKPVHQTASVARSIFKQHVGLYHDSVRQRVRRANRILAQLRRHGVFVKEDEMQRADQRESLLSRLPSSRLLGEDLQWLWREYDMLVEESTSFEEALTRQARTFEPIRRFVKLPGIAWIRAATFFAYIDTPWRFRGKSPLWKYMGIGLDRRHSGGGHTQLHVTKQANRIVKGMILGAAVTAIDQGENPFADQYRHWINEGGLSPRNARRNVARSLAATLWGMWKNGTEYRPDWVGGGFGKAVSDASL
jgi:transposase